MAHSQAGAQCQEQSRRETNKRLTAMCSLLPILYVSLIMMEAATSILGISGVLEGQRGKVLLLLLTPTLCAMAAHWVALAIQGAWAA